MPKRQIIIFMFCLIVNNIFCVINQKDARKIGHLIWHNESNKRKDLLVFWSKYESFPSLGIGHCIWAPEGKTIPYEQTFPLLCNFLQKRGVKLPDWLDKARKTGAPWTSREEFLKDHKRHKELRDLLLSTVDYQAMYMIERLQEQWPLILSKAPTAKRTRLNSYFELMRSSLLGTYALVDYLNFKGSGLDPREESKGQKWGLL